MRIIDLEKKCQVRFMSIYLTPEEADWMRDEIGRLLADPEASEHFHISDEDMGRDISCSIITKRKLKDMKGYNSLEKAVLKDV